MTSVKATVSVGETAGLKVYLASLDDGSSHIVASLNGEAMFLTSEQARELSAHFRAAAEQLGDGHLTVSVTPPSRSSR